MSHCTVLRSDGQHARASSQYPVRTHISETEHEQCCAVHGKYHRVEWERKDTVSSKSAMQYVHTTGQGQRVSQRLQEGR